MARRHGCVRCDLQSRASKRQLDHVIWLHMIVPLYACATPTATCCSAHKIRDTAASRPPHLPSPGRQRTAAAHAGSSTKGLPHTLNAFACKSHDAMGASSPCSRQPVGQKTLVLSRAAAMYVGAGEYGWGCQRGFTKPGRPNTGALLGAATLIYITDPGWSHPPPGGVGQKARLRKKSKTAQRATARGPQAASQRPTAT